jgi:endonuclease/exonuclease/phosphatase family metal-dependent hydrolase
LRFLSWNIQWCRGLDGRVDPARIAAEARRLADPDIACFQEVADNFATLEGSRGEDQVAALAREFARYEIAYGVAVDVSDGAGGRRRFGNLILSRLPIRGVLRHSLPWPADPEVPSMPRAALEAVIEAPFGPLRVTTTHLEYYSGAQRAAQIERLRELHAEACAHSARPPKDRVGSALFERRARPCSAILCGDFNIAPEDPLHARVLAPFADAVPRFVDAWHCAHPAAPRAPTFHVHDGERGAPAYCCDYVLVSEDLARRVVDVRVDGETRASDHQPVIVEFGE